MQTAAEEGPLLKNKKIYTVRIYSHTVPIIYSLPHLINILLITPPNNMEQQHCLF